MKFFKIVLIRMYKKMKDIGVYNTLLLTFHKIKVQITNRSINISPSISDEKKVYEEEYRFNNSPLISIIVPLYNTPQLYLKEMLNSCINQTYKNWELVLADGSTITTVEEICKEYQLTDNRIVYKKLDKNKGISDNSNEALKIAKGEYVALLDHDDILHPSALFEVVIAIDKYDPDFIYTDEALTYPHNLVVPVIKPDFDIFYLKSSNYICHLSIIKKDLLDKIGHFDSNYNGSQDYDLFLRVVDKTNKIYHIPKILYFWRAHAESTSLNASSKSYTTEASIKALTEHLKRNNINGKVESNEVNRFNIVYKNNLKPKVSIIITNIVDSDKNIIENIKQNINYDNYEIIELSKSKSKSKNSSTNLEDIETLETLNNIITDLNSEYILLIDANIRLNENFSLDNLLGYSILDNVGSVTLPILYKNNKIHSLGLSVKEHIATYNSRGDNFNYLKLTDPINRYIHKVDAVSDKFILFSKKAFNETKGLDTDLSYEISIIFFTLKLSKLMYNNIIINSSTLTYLGKKAINKSITIYQPDI